ncbi:chromosome transmission fidelity protein 8 [Xylariales sp. PMI_506]|nr:chromosome transmission fidelity protein 8 [Xylariales sp. PMI_506]
MASVQLHPRRAGSSPLNSADNPLPQLIQTPSGLALLELQGTINLPQADPAEGSGKAPNVPIGRVSFPDFNPNALDPSSTAWMKRVHLYVGQHQRLTGECKKLPKAIAVMRKRHAGDTASSGSTEDLEVVEIVKYKLIFSQRPEPVGTT